MNDGSKGSLESGSSRKAATGLKVNTPGYWCIDERSGQRVTVPLGPLYHTAPLTGGRRRSDPTYDVGLLWKHAVLRAAPPPRSAATLVSFLGVAPQSPKPDASPPPFPPPS